MMNDKQFDELLSSVRDMGRRNIKRVARSAGCSAQELGKIQRMVKTHQTFLKEA